MAENINHVSDFKWNNRVLVIVENGESGSAVAAPIAKKIIEKYQLVINQNEQ